MNMNFLKWTLAASVLAFVALTVSGTSALEPIVGGDKDTHGCIGSAGYSWDFWLEKCARPWEEKTSLLIVAPKKVPCVGEAPMECLQVKKDGKWGYFYSPIDGFDYESGYMYTIRVIEKHIENPPADGSSIEYTLVSLISKTPLRNTVWDIVSLNGKKISSFGRIAFVKGQIQAKFCNRMSGAYSLQDNRIVSSGLVSTEMFCESDNMGLENAFNPSGAKWELKGNNLVITTSKNDVMIWKQR